MLSIGKLAAGAEEYYLSAVDAGVEDYYLGPTEAPGRWAASAHLRPSREVRLGLAEIVGCPPRLCELSAAGVSRSKWPWPSGANYQPEQPRWRRRTPERPRTTRGGPESLAGEWRERAGGLGFGPEQLSPVVHTAIDLTSRLTTTLTDALSDPHSLAHRLTEEHSSFDRYAVLRELAEDAQAGASVTELDAAADGFCQRSSSHCGHRPARRDAVSTPKLLVLEAELLEHADRVCSLEWRD